MGLPQIDVGLKWGMLVLTDLEDGSILVNPNAIVALSEERRSWWRRDVCTVVELSTGTELFVAESVEQIGEWLST